MMGSPSNNASKRAAQQEGLRQANINRSMQAIDQAYSNPRREAEIGDFLSASRSFYRDNLDRQKDVADRSLRFAMARSGLTGGSATVDANRRLGEDYQRGILSADRMAQGAANELRSADEQSRMGLMSLAQSGADLTAGGGRAAASMRANLEGARAQLTHDALGDVFGGLSNIYETSRNAAAERRGNRDVYNLLYQPGYGQGGR